MPGLLLMLWIGQVSGYPAFGTRLEVRQWAWTDCPSSHPSGALCMFPLWFRGEEVLQRLRAEGDGRAYRRLHVALVDDWGAQRCQRWQALPLPLEGECLPRSD